MRRTASFAGHPREAGLESMKEGETSISRVATQGLQALPTAGGPEFMQQPALTSKRRPVRRTVSFGGFAMRAALASVQEEKEEEEKEARSAGGGAPSMQGPQSRAPDAQHMSASLGQAQQKHTLNALPTDATPKDPGLEARGSCIARHPPGSQQVAQQGSRSAPVLSGWGRQAGLSWCICLCASAGLDMSACVCVCMAVLAVVTMVVGRNRAR